MIKANMIDAVKVKFLKQIFEEDFPRARHDRVADWNRVGA